MTASVMLHAVLKADRLSAGVDGEPLFDEVSFTLGPGERLGVVGPNGVGKSTLLRLLAGQIRPDNGHLAAPAEVGFLEQEIPDPSVRVGDYLASGLAEMHAVRQRMRALESALATDPSALSAYGDAVDEWTALSGWEFESRIAELRDRLGIADLPDETPMSRVSGGQQARLMLARLLLRDPPLLLLDEPTNHLDAAGVAWLGDYLSRYRGGVVIVSHDRAFLDRTVHRIMELDGIHTEPQWYTGGYTDYRAERARRWQKLLTDFEAQEKARLRLEADIERTRGQALGVEQSTHNDRLRRYAKKVAKKAKARERRLRRQMRSTAWIARPTERPRLVVDLAAESDPALTVARLSSARLDLAHRTVLDGVDLTIAGGDRVVVTGTNGGGKSTLLRALSGELTPAAGTVEVLAQVGYLPQVHDDLPMTASPLSYLRGKLALYEEDAEALLDTYLFDADAIRRPLHRFSPGEIRRLLVACLVNSGAELLLLDEPTNHLDFDSLDVVEEALRAFRGTLVVVTHDQYFADRLDPTHTWRVGGGVCSGESRLRVS
ncbi:ribosomal protection-like ABC-F family protein [Actinokineospora iranica]|uniref:ATPase components of ABC transporters with duplicated ATPase domains n=1 Tax=Actinokineospora iranica TaxID=1271860 RepID=A0A1G6Y5I9_9PSEU|nr:ABC-F family ATP-binding cassette domain-containing protein [Actinokineospora iranica]SDD85243.1 ATPase components of ABC transporters with duplicated ATPase domains [Actinokineospora iranica]